MSKKNRIARKQAAQGVNSSSADRRRALAQGHLNRTSRREALIKWSIYSVVLVVVIGLATAIGVTIHNSNQKTTKYTAVTTPANATKDFGVVYDHTVTGAAAPSTKPVKVAVVEDFGCPYCAQFEQANGAQFQQLADTGVVNLEYRMVSFLDQNSGDLAYSSNAASAALCVRDAGGMKAWKQYHDWLFANQPEEGNHAAYSAMKRSFYDEAKKIAPTVDEHCVRGGKYVPWMQKATEAFTKANIGGTPTFIIDGEKFNGTTVAEGITKAWEKLNPGKTMPVSIASSETGQSSAR